MSSFLEKLKRGMGVEGLNEKEVFAEDSTTDKTEKEPQKSENKIKPDENKAKKKKIAQEKKTKESFQKKLEQKEKPEKTKKLGPVPNKEKELKIAEKEKKETKQWFEPEGQLVVDVFQTDGEIVVQSAVAGVKPEELDISVENDVLTIKGKRERPMEKEPVNYFYQECYWGRFSREIILPAEVDLSQTKATIKEGVLTIRIPKIDKEKRKKISIKE